MIKFYQSPDCGEISLELADSSLANTSWSDVSGGGSYGSGDIHDNGNFEIINY
ncbi:MAG: hypothetical protein J5871_00165 [Bacteroidales bacterium]|nr:hypothetical protein [Bacteroidales bacterium]